MEDGTFKLQKKTQKKVNEYRHKVFDYFKAMTVENKMMDVDPFDPSIPGVSEEFIRNHDLNDIQFDGRSLEVNEYCRMYVLLDPGQSVIQSLRTAIEEQFEGYTIDRISGHFFYPREQGFMGWHTNSDQPGYRVYLTYVPESNKSYFRYYDHETGEIVTDWDKKGWNARYFYTDDNPENYYWHCVYSETDRLSIGLALREIK